MVGDVSDITSLKKGLQGVRAVICPTKVTSSSFTGENENSFGHSSLDGILCSFITFCSCAVFSYDSSKSVVIFALVFF